jgi:hypothetical protein
LLWQHLVRCAFAALSERSAVLFVSLCLINVKSIAAHLKTL